MSSDSDQPIRICPANFKFAARTALAVVEYAEAAFEEYAAYHGLDGTWYFHNIEAGNFSFTHISGDYDHTITWDQVIRFHPDKQV